MRHETITTLNIDSEEFSNIEKYKIDKALDQMKENTAPGKDEIIVEFIKEGGQKIRKYDTTDE